MTKTIANVNEFLVTFTFSKFSMKLAVTPTDYIFALATFGNATQIEIILSVSCHPKQVNSLSQSLGVSPDNFANVNVKK